MNATTTTTGKTKTRKVSQAKHDSAPVADVESLPLPLDTSEPNPFMVQHIPLDLIDCEPQIRTTFDEETLKQLAEDIARRGVLQPIIIRPANDGRFVIVAGERRYRAASLASCKTIPTIVRTGDVAELRAIQLAENIHREDLSLADTAQAIKELYDTHGSLLAVANACKKSKPWVSKRLSLAQGLQPLATNLMVDGHCEDLEILKALSQIQQLTPGQNNAWSLFEAVRKGEAGRKEARAALTEAKDEADPAKRLARVEKENAEYAEKKEKADQARQEKTEAEEAARRELEAVSFRCITHRILQEMREHGLSSEATLELLTGKEWQIVADRTQAIMALNDDNHLTLAVVMQGKFSEFENAVFVISRKTWANGEAPTLKDVLDLIAISWTVNAPDGAV